MSEQKESDKKKVIELASHAKYINRIENSDDPQRPEREASMQVEEICKLYLERLTAEGDKARSENRAFLAEIRTKQAEIMTEITKVNATAEGVRSDHRVFVSEIKSNIEQLRGLNDRTQSSLDGVRDSLKSSIESFRHNQSTGAKWITAIIGVLLTIIIFFSGYIVTRIDAIDNTIDNIKKSSVNLPPAPK